MSGLPTLLVELDDGTGTFPYDITAYVNMQSGWSLDRGRRDEFSDIDASIARLVLNNRDGRFTFGSAAYDIAVDQRVRITETFGGGTPSKRITGYAQEWPVEWDDPAGLYAPCSITLSDRQSRLTRRTLDQVFASELLRDSPAFLYMLGEAAGATSVGDTSGKGRKALPVRDATPAVVFGEVALTDNTGAAFTANGQYVRGTLGATPGVLTLGITFIVPTLPTLDQTLAVLDSTTTTTALELKVRATGEMYGTLQLGASGYGMLSAALVADGLPHRATIQADPTTGQVKMTVDDGPPDTSAGPGPFSDPAFNRLTIGQFTTSTATMLGVAGYVGLLGTTRPAAHHLAQGSLATDSSDERIERLAAYAGLGSGDLALEAGLLESVAEQSTNGAGVWSAMTDVAKAEGGVLFVRGDGKLVMQNRTHRTLAASQTPAVALDSEDVDHNDLRIVADKQYLSNIVRGSRANGAEQKVRNDASIARHDEYPSDYSGLLVTTDDEVLDRISWQAGAYAEVSPRLNTVTVDLMTLADAAVVQALLALEIGDRITVAGLPAATSPMTTADLIVEGLSESQTHSSWRLTLNTVAADLFRAWVLGDAVYGVLDSTTKLHY